MSIKHYLIGAFLLCASTTSEARELAIAEFFLMGIPVEVVATEEYFAKAARATAHSGTLEKWPPPLTFDQAVEIAISFLDKGFISSERKMYQIESVSLKPLNNKVSVYCVGVSMLEGPSVVVGVMMDGSVLPMRIKGKSVLFTKLDPGVVRQEARGE